MRFEGQSGDGEIRNGNEIDGELCEAVCGAEGGACGGGG